MTKQAYLAELQKKLCGLPAADIEERLAFYGEMIDDRMEEGLTEAAALADIGAVEEVAAQIVAATPLLKLAKERIKPKRRLHAAERVLLWAGSPIWLALGIAALAVLISLYASLWSVLVSLWAAFSALAGGALGGLSGGIVLLCTTAPLTGIALLAAALVCAGLAIFAFWGCLAATRGTLRLTRRLAVWTKRLVARKEATQ